ncbi:hypothetical protein Cpap_0891 [Ruminiclostridium papyrosolvens DSM 2782]|uniref:Uncharacterized protein n=2 Tax=Ruminiclostridium papyrosolvens TaxID=29362 RepID=F1TH39_9FIRM|nr:hypothetical protein [Ruminiclostridium papyrosolvens]EGD46279.1 hypothetical protein Cpap_0891 [Ruminiclostridium papyrosolvens DSM 2782]
MISEVNNKLIEILKAISKLKAEQVALFSIIVSFLIYLMGKRNELHLKKYEAKKQQYIKFIELLENVFSQMNKKQFKNAEEMKKSFFDVGSSLLLYGSKKLYKQYVFFREFSSNPLVEKCKYYDEGLSLYLMAEMLRTIRKEVGLNFLDSVSQVEALAFFVNDVAFNPCSKIKISNSKFSLKMIKIELFFIERLQLVYTKRLFYNYAMPILGTFNLIIKYFILMPLIKLLIFLFPNIKEKISKSQPKKEAT